MKKAIFFCLLILAIFIGATLNQKPERPNVLLFYMDDLRPELGSFGALQIHSPNIDSFAKKGMKFTNAYCNIPVCGASRASMLTGMLPTKNRFLNYNTFVEKETQEAITLPELFKTNGYTTISNGKIYHHLDDRKSDWDEIWRPYAFDKNKDDLAPTDYWQSLWKDYQNQDNHSRYQITDNGPAYECSEVSDYTYIDGLLTLKVMRDIEKLKNANKPFFLTAGFISNHLPFNAPKKYWDLYEKNLVEQPENFNYIPKGAPNMSISNWPEMRAYSNIPKKGQVSDSVAVDLIHGYYATISYVDALIGKILGEIKEQKLDHNTIVILVSDHGYNLQEHTQWAKFTSYNTSTQVPLVIYNPFSKAKGTTNALTSLVDIYPTIAELCGLGVPENQLDGTSLAPVLNNPNLDGKSHVFIKKNNAFTIKTRDFSYTEFIKPEDNTIIDKMLYDHRISKVENINIANKMEFKNTVSELNYILHSEYQKNIIGF